MLCERRALEARAARSLSPSCSWLSSFENHERRSQCLTSIVWASTGAAASSSSRPERSRVRPTAPCSRHTATPPCWPPSSSAKQPREGVDFLPAHRQLPGEILSPPAAFPAATSSAKAARPRRETLISRLIDRPIRPLFANGYRCETQVIVTTMSHDLENDPDIVAMVAASAALTLVGRAVHGSDRRRPRRLHQQRIRAQPAARRDDGEPARPRRRRHRRRRADGRIGSQGAARGGDARRRDVRPPAFPAGDRRHHQARREGREGAARLHRSPTTRRWRRKCSAWSSRTCAPPMRSPSKMERHKARRCRQGQGDGALLPGGRESRATTSCASAACSRSSKPRSCAGTSSIPASASTAAT